MIEHLRLPFSSLVFLDDNPRTRTPEGLQQMAADIQADPTFFENRPVLVNLTDGRYQNSTPPSPSPATEKNTQHEHKKTI